ncbi:phage tail tube protein [Novosphingobium humi]|uniref:Phage tail tube protein n=1 Tax=Novosphingobium humi TaxID=2282397 RepID=A0ABY7U3M9_9SPHN|nr:phage tail tube protein [Novosphingobium humi]WCT78879.1 phage tail tube protein [Novosphingobium humi]
MTAVAQYGKDTRTLIKSGSTFIPIAGEQKASRKGSSDSIDTTSKDDGNYKTNGFGQKSITISVNGITKLPDPGYSRLYEVQKQAVPVEEFQLVNELTGEVFFQAKMSVGNFSDDYDQRNGASWSIDLALAAAPTIDKVPDPSYAGSGG